VARRPGLPQPCSVAERSGCFAAIGSGFDCDQDALPIRTCTRVLKAKLKVGDSVAYVLREPRLAYLVPSSTVIGVKGVQIRVRDGVAIKGVDIVTIKAVEDADVLMVDVQ
jgi:quercetin 2,3-dioxygenase